MQLFHDAPTTELPLSMLSSSSSNGEGGLTAVDLAVKSGAAKSQCMWSCTCVLAVWGGVG